MGRAARSATLGVAATAAVALATIGTATALRAAEITEAEAQAIGVDAYLYFYPLITMDVTRSQLTNVEAGKSEIGGPTNMFTNVQAFPTAEMRAVVRPNFDTLYSSGWLDLTKEPMVVSVPDTGGRYYLLPMLDMWTDVFASPGWRTTGTRRRISSSRRPAGTATASRSQPAESTQPSTRRRLTSGSSAAPRRTARPDYDAVHKIQAGYKITPLSQWGKRAGRCRSHDRPDRRHEDAAEGAGRYDAGRQVFRLCRRASEAASAAHHRPADHRAHEADRSRAGQELRLRQGRSGRAAGARSAPAAAQKLMEWKVPTLARVANGWSMNTDTMGVYGNYYLKRAIVAQSGLGANLPEDAIYPLNLADDDRQAARRRQPNTRCTSTRASCRPSTPSGR